MNLTKYAKEYWVTYNPTLADGVIGFELDTKRIKLGDGINNWNNLEYQPEALGLVPEWFGVRGYATEDEALNNASTDATNNSNILNELIDIAQEICAPINFNKYFYCIEHSILLHPYTGVSSPQALFEGFTLNGNQATLIICSEEPAILITGSNNTVNDFNLTFNKQIFESINGRMYFEHSNYLDIQEKPYYEASLLKIASGYSKFLAHHNRIENVKAYNPNPWGAGAADTTYWFEDKLCGTAFEIELNQAKAYSYLNLFTDCVAMQLGEALKLNLVGEAIKSNMEINANTFDISSWSCEHYIIGTGHGNTFSGNVQSSRLKVKYVDQNGKDVLLKSPYCSPIMSSVWQDANNKMVAYSVINDRWEWINENGEPVNRFLKSGKMFWRATQTAEATYEGGLKLVDILEQDLYPYALEGNDDSLLITDNGSIIVQGVDALGEQNYKTLFLNPGKYVLNIEDFAIGNPVADQTFAEHYVMANGARYDAGMEFEITEPTLVSLYFNVYNVCVSMKCGINYLANFKPRLMKTEVAEQNYKLQKNNEFLIEEVGGRLSSNIFNNMFFDTETQSSQTDEKILNQTGSSSLPIMNQRLIEIKGIRNHFVRPITQNSVFGNYTQNKFWFCEGNSKDILLTSPILSNDLVNTINLLPTTNSYDEAIDLSKVDITIDAQGLCFDNTVSLIEGLVFGEDGFADISNDKEEFYNDLDKQNVSPEKIAKMFGNFSTGRALPIRPLLNNYKVDKNGQFILKPNAERPHLQIKITGKKLANFYYKVGPLFAIFANGGATYDDSKLTLKIDNNALVEINGKSMDSSNYVIAYINSNRKTVREMTLDIYFKPVATAFKVNSDGTAQFSTNSANLSQFIGQLASWNNGFLGGNSKAKEDEDGNRIKEYYATKDEIEALKAEIEQLKKKMM